jgi:HD-like signal output (HDOD) protein
MISGRVAAKNFDKFGFWSHSLASATACRILGKMQIPEKAEELYLAGMMHDVGYLVLDRFYPGELDEAIRVAHAEKITVAAAEQKLFGFDHGDVGGMLARKWGLPKPLEQAIHFHHRVAEDDVHPELTSIVSVADFLAHQAGLTNNSPAEATQLDACAGQLVGLPDQQLSVVSEVMMQEVAKAQSAFAMPMAA